MRGVPMICWGARLLTLIALGTILTGCGMLGSFTNTDITRGSRIGLRPDDPVINVKPDDSCDELKRYVVYAVNLKEAYRARTTQNRSWIYVAGATGLGVAAASGGLAAAGAAGAGTLGLLAISGGFTSGVFATINNAELANVYTVAANDIGTALANTQGRIVRCSQSREECSAEVTYLSNRVTSVRNTLETARTSSAAGALARAAASKKLLDEEITKVQAQVEAENKAKEAAQKKAAATAAQGEADAKKAQAETDKDAADKTPKGPVKDKAEKKAEESAQEAKVAEKKAADAAEAAKDAEAKAKADADALAAATAPVTPACLSPTGKVVLNGNILSFNGSTSMPVTVDFVKDTAKPVNAVVTNVDLRNISNESLSIDVGGKSGRVIEKAQKSVDDPYIWTVRFVPPDQRSEDAEVEYLPSLFYVKQPLATAQTARIKYPKR
jgi:hypothetical protein